MTKEMRDLIYRQSCLEFNKKELINSIDDVKRKIEHIRWHECPHDWKPLGEVVLSCDLCADTRIVEPKDLSTGGESERKEEEEWDKSCNTCQIRGDRNLCGNCHAYSNRVAKDLSTGSE